MARADACFLHDLFLPCFQIRDRVQAAQAQQSEAERPCPGERQRQGGDRTFEMRSEGMRKDARPQPCRRAAEYRKHKPPHRPQGEPGFAPQEEQVCARCTGAAPRYSGRREPWTFIQPYSG